MNLAETETSKALNNSHFSVADPEKKGLNRSYKEPEGKEDDEQRRWVSEGEMRRPLAPASRESGMRDEETLLIKQSDSNASEQMVPHTSTNLKNFGCYSFYYNFN